MKPIHFLAPVLTFVGCVFMIAGQDDTLTELREKTRVVEERLELVTSAPAPSPDIPISERGKNDSTSTDKFSLPNGSPDWEAILTLMKDSLVQTRSPYSPTDSPDFQQRLAELNESEITAGLAKIQALDLDEKSKQRFKAILLSRLASKDPLKTLELIGGPISDRNNSLSWTQNSAFTALAKKDPAAAMAWLDQQVNAGKLVDTSLQPADNPRFNMELALIGQLIESDLTTALARAAVLSERERRQLAGSAALWLRDGKMPVGYLTLARETLSTDRATSSIACAWSANSRRPLTAVDTALKEIPFSEKEREAIINRSVENFTQVGNVKNDYETAYQWAAKQSPNVAASAIAHALLDGGSRRYSFDEKFEKTMQLAEKFDDPSLITEFARQHNPNRSDQKFKDPALHEKMNELRQTLPKETE